MSKQILIELNARDNATKKIKNAEQSVSSLGRKVKTSSMSQAKSFEDVSTTLDALGNRFRYLSLVASMAAGAMIMTGKNFVDASIDMQNSLIGLSAVAGGTGNSMDEANKIAIRFASTGLMSVADAANTLKQLLAKGYGLKQATNLMNVMTDAAVFNRQGVLSIGQAMRGTAEGIKNDMSMKTDNVGITKNLSVMEKEYAASIGTTIGKLSEAQKREAVYQGFMKEGALFRGNAALATKTLGGEISKLGGIATQTSAALGNTLQPVLSPIVEQFTKAASTVKAFAEEFPALSMVIITGSISVTTFIAAIAMLGALVPMVTGKMKIGIKALKDMGKVSLLTSLKFIALAVAVGTLIYLIAKVTGKWDGFIKKMKDLKNKLAGVTKVAKGTNKEMTDPKVTKQLKKIADQMKLTTRSFKEGMREWVDKHDKTIKDLKSQINDLEREYSRALNKINDNFNDTQKDESLSHRRKVEDIQREIDEEISKGLWADQTKIRNLKKELARENEDYGISQKRNKDRKKDDLKDTNDKYSERLTKLKGELADEEELEKKHSEQVSKYRTWPILDEIEKQERQYKERIEQLQEQMAEVKGNADAQIAANGDVNTSIGELIGAQEEQRKHSIWSIKGIVEAWKNAKDNIIFASGEIEKGLVKSWDNIKWGIQKVVDLLRGINWYNIGQEIRKWLVGVFEWFMTVLSEVDKQFREFVAWIEAKVKNIKPPSPPAIVNAATTISGGIGDIGAGIGDFIQGLIGKKWWEFSEGGVVPGRVGQAVPAIVHGGETVVPAGESLITVNINNPSVRNDNDIIKIANQVQEILSRKTYLRQFK